MGSTSSYMLVGGSEDLLSESIELVRECERLWSRFIATSDISRLNWAEGRPTEVSELTVRLIRAMIEGVELTGGAFDPTLLPDVVAAGYATSIVHPDRTTTLPDSAKAPGNTRGIRIDELTVTLPVGTTLDPGGIGKGLAADLVCEFALAEGAWGALAEVGGDIVVAGQPNEGVAWRLGVENPFDTDAHSAIVRLSRGALATSSQRKRRFSTSGGERHHLIDPGAHTSAATTVQTVSVIAATGARAETLTKAGFIRNTTDYLEWLPSVGAAGLVIDENGTETVSSNWGRYL